MIMTFKVENFIDSMKTTDSDSNLKILIPMGSIRISMFNEDKDLHVSLNTRFYHKLQILPWSALILYIIKCEFEIKNIN